MLDFRMETFLAVCQYMNFTKASEKLNITQPAVSQHIRFLEKHYNTKLFRYEGKKLRLTGAGEILRNASLTMMHDEQSMQNEMQKTEQEAEIRFGATRTIGDAVMGQVLEKYLARYPQARIHMEVENTHDLLVRLDEGRIDFALVEGFFKKTEYDFQIFSREKYIAVCSPDYTFRNTPDCIEKLFQERLLLREEGSGTRQEAQKLLLQMGIDMAELNVAAIMENQETIKRSVENGMGISILSDLAVRDAVQAGKLFSFPLGRTGGKRDIYLVSDEGYPSLPGADKFIRTVKEIYHTDTERITLRSEDKDCCRMNDQSF